jgi:hypothetical protein
MISHSYVNVYQRVILTPEHAVYVTRWPNLVHNIYTLKISLFFGMFLNLLRCIEGDLVATHNRHISCWLKPL